MLNLYGEIFKSRILLGTARYSSPEVLQRSILSSRTEIVTVSLRRQAAELQLRNKFWEYLKTCSVKILPNTSHCYTAKEAVTTAKMAREIFQTNWIKLEVFGDEHTLQPHPLELLYAAEALIKEGFFVFPYTTDDLVLCKELAQMGCQVLMPWAAPIGTGKGISSVSNLKIIRERFPNLSLIIDAGLGAPSHAALAFELGYDAILLNTAVAMSHDPISMAEAFYYASCAGRQGYLAGLMPSYETAQTSSPVEGVGFRI